MFHQVHLHLVLNLFHFPPSFEHSGALTFVRNFNEIHLRMLEIDGPLTGDRDIERIQIQEPF